jgi:hypothetical protein
MTKLSQDFADVSSRLEVIKARLRDAMDQLAPRGYQDEKGFHLGVKSAESRNAVTCESPMKRLQKARARS